MIYNLPVYSLAAPWSLPDCNVEKVPSCADLVLCMLVGMIEEFNWLYCLATSAVATFATGHQACIGLLVEKE